MLMATDQILPSLPPKAKVLFIRLRSLGDTVLTTPLYESLKNWRPDLQLAALVEEPHAAVLAGHPYLNRVFAIPDSQQACRQFKARWTVLRAIRKERFNLCINLHGGSTSALFTLLSGAQLKVGQQGFRNGYAYNLRIRVADHPTRKWHTVEYNIQSLRALGLPNGEIPPLRVYPNPAEGAAILSKLQEAGIEPGSAYCLVQPASKFITKQWSAAGFAEVADFLLAHHSLKVVLAGGRGERQQLEAVAQACQSRPPILDDLSLPELVEVIHGARLFIGNDSGPTHIAVALNVPVVVLFGSSDSAAWHPWKGKNQIVQNLFACNPCPGYRCLVYDEPRCILSITSGQVKQAIQAILGS